MIVKVLLRSIFDISLSGYDTYMEVSMKLQEWLDEIKAGFEKQAPAEALEIMHGATQKLIDSGAMDKLIKAGEKLPEFQLENVKGELIKSADLLANGPLVIGFYRGVW